MTILAITSATMTTVSHAWTVGKGRAARRLFATRKCAALGLCAPARVFANVDQTGLARLAKFVYHETTVSMGHVPSAVTVFAILATAVIIATKL